MRRWCKLLCWIVAALCVAVGAKAKDEVPKAKISVDGLGLIANRTVRFSIARLYGERLPPELDSNQIEDGALFIASYLDQDGFRRPSITVEAKLRDGTTRRFAVSGDMEELAPPGLHATAVAYAVKKGVRSYYRKIDIEGIHVVSEAEARAFFFSEATLVDKKASRAFSKSRLRRATDALESTLRQRGYAEATVTADEPVENRETGEVDVTIRVKEGPRWELQRVQIDLQGPETSALATLRERKGTPWSNFRGQDLAEEIRRMYFKN